MKKFLFALGMLIGLTGVSQGQNKYMQTIAFVAKAPDSSWSFLSATGTGALALGAAGNGTISPGTTYIQPFAPMALDVNGVFQYLTVDATGALMVSGGGGGGTVPATAPAHSFWGNNTGVAGATAAYVVITAADVPTLNQNTTGTASNLSGSQTQNFFYASPNGSGGTGSWRAIVAADIPTLNQNTTGTSASATTATTAVNLSGSQTANFFYAAPNGSSGTGTWRAIVVADIPTLNQSTTGNALTATTAVNLSGSQTANFVYASPSGSSGTGTWRALVALDIPALAYSTLTGKPALPVTNAGATSNFLTTYDSTTGLFTKAQPAFTDISGVLGVGQFGTGVRSVTLTADTLLSTDNYGAVRYSNAGAVAVTIPDTTTAGFGAGAIFTLKNTGAGVVTVTRTSTSTIDGGTNIAIANGQSTVLFSDGTNWREYGGRGASTNVANTWTFRQTFQAGNFFLGGVGSYTTSATATVTDEGRLMFLNAATAQTLTIPDPATSGFGAGAMFHYLNTNVGIWTITRTTSAVFRPNALTSFTLAPGQSIDFWSNGTDYYVQQSTLSTQTNCTSTGGTCSSAQAGAVTVAAAATTVTVASTAVTAKSRIFLTEDSSLGTDLSVTCNTTTATTLSVTARTAGTSFVITTNAPTTNPRCISYQVVN